MIDSIKKLLSGILSFLIGLVGGKKSQEQLPANNNKGRKSKGYFLELNESEETKSVNGNQPAKAEAAKKPEPGTANKPAKVEAAKKPEPATANKPAKAEAAKKPEPATANKPAKAEAAKKTKATEEKQAAKVSLVQTAEGLKAEPTKPVKAPAATAETTFAPKYLAPSASSNGRRRPGANMSNFLDMARQVKTPG
jgi:DNA polymerase III gamma/tau subunit